VKASIVLLPGDGIGPEVVAATTSVLDKVAATFGHEFSYSEQLIGGIAIDETGHPLPDETLAACRQADAILLGAVGGPKWDDPQASVRPEQGLLGVRKALGLYANLRPVKVQPLFAEFSPLRQERLDGVDMLIVRELTGGIYFGSPRKRETVDGVERALDTMVYDENEVRRIVRLACDIARGRRKKVTSVDKANVLESSRLWRKVATEVAAEYPDIEMDHQLVDSAAMRLITGAAEFDVVVTGNMFGDILSDEASVLTGSLGMLPSASMNEDKLGLYEPIHGSAPDIAGQGIANPLATILSAAMLLNHSLNLPAEARAVEAAVDAVLEAGLRTADLGEGTRVTTEQMGAAVCERVRKS